MSKRFAAIRPATPALIAALFALSLAAVPARAADPAQAGDVRASRPAAQPAAAAPRKAKTPRAPRPARPPEKSIAEQRALDGLWAKQTNWMTFRAGYAKGGSQFAGNGLVGYGIGYQRLITRRWGFGGSVQHDVLGHLGRSTEISLPMTLELTRHFNWKTAMRPYLEVGGGYYFHRYNRTGNGNGGRPGRGTFVGAGVNLPTGARHLLGFDARASFVKGRENVVDPVFGEEKTTQLQWSAKASWSFAYY